MNISLRSISAQDLPFLFQVYASTRAEELAQTGWPEAQQLAFLQMQFNAQHEHYQQHFSESSFDLVLLDDKPVGRLYVAVWPTQIRIVDIALLTQFRGRGIGSILMKRLFEQAHSRQLEISIHVENNNPAMHWYKKLGFHVIENKGVYSLMETSIFKEEETVKSGGETILE